MELQPGMEAIAWGANRLPYEAEPRFCPESEDGHVVWRYNGGTSPGLFVTDRIGAERPTQASNLWSLE